MIEGVSLQNPVFVNTLGHASGLLLFGLLIVLLLGKPRKTGAVSSAPPQGSAGFFAVWRRTAAPFALQKSWDRADTRQQIATLIAACLAFLWNLGSLAGLGQH